MDKRYLTLSVLISISMLTGCGGVSKGKEGTEGKSIASESPSATDYAEEKGVKDIWWNESDFYGTWKVKERVETSNIYGLPEEKIRELIGTELYIFESYFDSTTLRGRINDPEYNMMVMETEDFTKGFKLNEEDKEALSLSRKEMLVVDINFPEGEEESFGSHIFLVDRDTLLVMENGVFFKAERFEPADGALPEEEVSKAEEITDENGK